jgi:hypothetical protein
MGGWTGMQFTRAHRERVAALVLSGTPAGVMTPKVLQALATIGTAAAQLEHTPAWDDAHPALAADVFKRDPERGFLYAQIAAINPPLALAKLALHESMTEPAALAGWAIPTLLVCGEHDRIFSPEILADVASAIPSTRFTSLPYAGHSPYFETPGEFNRVVAEFLEQHWPRGWRRRAACATGPPSGRPLPLGEEHTWAPSTGSPSPRSAPGSTGLRAGGGHGALRAPPARRPVLPGMRCFGVAELNRGSRHRMRGRGPP